jgi:hypothetical protein
MDHQLSWRPRTLGKGYDALQVGIYDGDARRLNDEEKTTRVPNQRLYAFIAATIR